MEPICCLILPNQIQIQMDQCLNLIKPWQTKNCQKGLIANIKKKGCKPGLARSSKPKLIDKLKSLF